MAGPEVKDREWQTGLPPDTGVWHDELPPDPQGIDLPAYKPKWKQGPLPDVNAFLQQRAMQDMPTENLREERDKSLHLFETFGIPWFKDANAERLKAAKSKQDRFYKNWNAMMGAAPYGRQKALESIHPVQMVKEIAKGFTRFVESGVFGSSATAVEWVGEFIELGGGAVDQFSKLFSKNPDQIYNPYAEAIIAAGRDIAKYGRESRENFTIYAMTGWEKLDEKMRETDLASYWSGQISEGVASSALSVLAVYLSGGVGAAGLIDKGMKVNKGLALLSTMSAAGGYQHARTQDENFMWSTVHGLADGMIEYAAETTFLEGVGKSSKALTSGFKEGGEEFFTGMLQNTRAGILENEKKGMSAYEGAKAAIISALQQAPLEVVAGFIGGYGMQGGANLTELVQKSRAVKKVETQQGIIDRTNKDVMEIRKKYKKSPKFAEKMISARIQQGMKELDVLEQTEEEAFAKEAEEAITPEAKGEVVPEAVQPPSQPSEEQPWTVSKKEYVGEIPATEASQEDWAKYSERRRKWSNATMAAVSRGDITAEQAEALGLPYDVRQWTGLPETLYHVTTAKTAVSKEGLKSRFELGQERGMGLGGGESEAISFTTDRKTAEGIKRGLLEARKVARGEITVQQMLDEAESGEGAEKPWLEDLMQNWQPGWKIGDAVPRGVSDLLRGVEHTRNVLGKTKAEMEGWSPTAEKPDFGNEKYIEWERPVSTEKQQEEAFDFYKRWAAHREVAGGPLDPLFFLSDVPGIAALDPGEIEIIEFKPRQGAMGMKKAALGEYITFSGEAVELAPSVAEKQAAAEAFRPEQMGGTPEEIVTPNLYIGNVTPGMKQRIAEGLEIDPKEVHGFLQEGFPTKRTSIKMTRAEATNYLTFATNLMDQMVQQIEETGSVTMTMNQLANVQALQGDIKALQAAIGYEVQPAQVTFRQAEKRKYAVTGEPIISQERFNEINKKIAAGEELTEQDKADMFVALQEEAAAVKATTEIHTTKQLIEAALRPDKLETIELPTLELFNRVMKGKEDAAKHAYIAGARDTVKQHKDLAAKAKADLKGLPVSEGQRNQLLNAIARARTDSERIVAQASVESVIEKATKQQAVREFKNLRNDLKKKFGTKKTQFGQMRPEFESRMNELLDGIDDSALSSEKESDLLGLQEKVHSLAAELQKEALAFNNDPDLRNEVVQKLLGIPDRRIAELGRLSKTPLKEMSAGDIDSLTREMSRLVGMNNLKSKLIEKGKVTDLGKSLSLMTDELVPSIAGRKGKDISGGLLKKLLISDPKTMPTYINDATGSIDNETSNRLLWNILESMSDRYLMERRVRAHAMGRMQEKGVTPADIRQWRNNAHIYNMHGKTYQLNDMQLLSLLMHMRNPENRAAVQHGLVVTEKLPLGGTQRTVIGAEILDEKGKPTGQYHLSLRDIGELLDPIYGSEKHTAMADIANEILDDLISPELSNTSIEIYGSDHFRVKKYWPMHRVLPRSMGGVKKQVTPLSERGFTYERVGGNQPLYLIPFLNQLLDSTESGAMYAKMMVPIFNAKSLVTSPGWQTAMVEAGRRDEMNLIMDKLATLEGNVTSNDALSQASGLIRRGYAAHSLLLNFSSIISQLTSEPMLGAVDPANYFTTRISYDSKIQEEIDTHNGVFWKRTNFGRTTKDIGDVRAVDGANEFFLGKRSPQGNMMRFQTATDSMPIQKAWKMANKYVAKAYPEIKSGSPEYWKAVNRRAFELSLTQPNWEPFLRSNYLTMPGPMGGLFLFRSPLEAMHNVVLRQPKSFKAWAAVGASLIAYRTVKELYYETVKAVPRWFGLGKKDDEEAGEKAINAAEELVYDASRVHPIGILLEPALRKVIDAARNRPSSMKFGRGNIYGMSGQMTLRLAESLTKGLKLKSEGKHKQAERYLEEATESAVEMMTIAMQLPYVGIVTPLRQWFTKDKSILEKEMDRMEIMMENMGTEDVEDRMDDILEQF